jgi:hypothetical protein
MDGQLCTDRSPTLAEERGSPRRSEKEERIHWCFRCCFSGGAPPSTVPLRTPVYSRCIRSGYPVNHSHLSDPLLKNTAPYRSRTRPQRSARRRRTVLRGASETRWSFPGQLSQHGAYAASRGAAGVAARGGRGAALAGRRFRCAREENRAGQLDVELAQTKRWRRAADNRAAALEEELRLLRPPTLDGRNSEIGKMKDHTSKNFYEHVDFLWRCFKRYDQADITALNVATLNKLHRETST